MLVAVDIPAIGLKTVSFNFAVLAKAWQTGADVQQLKS